MKANALPKNSADKRGINAYAVCSAIIAEKESEIMAYETNEN